LGIDLDPAQPSGGEGEGEEDARLIHMHALARPGAPVRMALLY
jgi:hypothetical protein